MPEAAGLGAFQAEQVYSPCATEHPTACYHIPPFLLLPTPLRLYSRSSYSPDTGQVLRPSATDENDLVLLEVVSFSGNVGDGGLAGRELDTAHLTHGRVGLTRLGRVDLGHDTLLLRAALEQRRLGLPGLVLAVAADDWGQLLLLEWEALPGNTMPCLSLQSSAVQGARQTAGRDKDCSAGEDTNAGSRSGRGAPRSRTRPAWRGGRGGRGGTRTRRGGRRGRGTTPRGR